MNPMTRYVLALLVLAAPDAALAQGRMSEKLDTHITFEDSSELGKLNYLGRIRPGQLQLPEDVKGTLNSLPEAGPREIQPGDLVYCWDTGCTPRKPPPPVVVPLIPLKPPVGADEFRIENTRGIALDLRVTINGVAEIMSIEAESGATRKLTANQLAEAEIRTGNLVTKATLLPGIVYEIRATDGVYFIVPMS
jgi:hypothetical protein